jgi:diadenosine tetraphosphate (Ap4A) HIT family hydrolase
MLPGTKAGFELDARLEAVSHPVLWLGLCEMRLMNDRRWPWIVLVPHRPGIEEMHELTPLDQAMLTFELNMVSQTLKQQTGCDKINTAILVNHIRQLHVHVVARSRNDPCWPGPVWGQDPREPYRREDLQRLVEKLRAAF